MNDDYQYQQLNLPPKNKGLFGYGGQPNEGAKGFMASIVDVSAGGGGSQGPQGPQGPTGQSFNLPLPPGTGTYVLGSINGAIQWISTTECLT